MTIVVAFVLEAFLFRIQYRKEHPTDEEGQLRHLLQTWYRACADALKHTGHRATQKQQQQQQQQQQLYNEIVLR